MERLLARWERRLGGFAIPNLMIYVVLGMAGVWLMAQTRPELPGRMLLIPSAVRHGQVWRLVTFLLVPPSFDPIGLFFDLWFMWWVGSSLDRQWGSFKFNAYYLVGALATIAAAFLVGPMTAFWLDVSLVLAFATEFPDETVLIAFVIPIRLKWLGAACAGYMVFSAAMGGVADKAAIAAALVNYLLFFVGYWRSTLRGRAVVARQQVRRKEMESAAPVFGNRSCAICGAKEAEGVDIRICTCDKCGGQPRALCLPHARAH
jgi:membrane associated rhomboid family serine protease